MVATRRGAQSVPEDDIDPTPALQKKPVRKATAAKAKPATKAAPETIAKPRATRSRKAAVELQAEPEVENVPEEDELAAVEAPVAKRATRSKRADTVEPVSKQPTKAANAADKPARAARTKAAAKGPEAPAQQEEELPAKPLLAAKPSRQTRAKADAAKPLSPKKVTQVAKSRATRAKPAADAEKATKSRPISALSNKRTGRKRGPANENEDVEEQQLVSTAQLDLIEQCLPAIKAASPAKASPRKQSAPPSEASMSSRATTPSGSPAPAFEQPKDYTEDHLDRVQSDVDEDEEDVQASGSEDELAGAKTPMKRINQQDDAVYFHSGQKSAHASPIKFNSQTPVPRFRLKTTRQGTPQTQKPYVKSAVSALEARTMSVARGADRATVHKPLQQLTPLADRSAQVDAEFAEEDMDNDERAMASDSPVQLAPSSPAEHVNEILELQKEPDRGSDLTNEDINETIVISDNEDESELTVDSPTAQPPSLHDVENIENTTISEPLQAPVATCESDDSVLACPEADMESEADDSFVVLGPTTPKPETIPWENLRQDVTIAINFDMLDANVRSPAVDAGATAMEPHMSDLDMSDLHHTAPGAQEDAPGRASARLSALDLNDFVDFGALAEPTARLEIPAAEELAEVDAPEVAHADAGMSLGDESESEPSEASVVITKAPESVSPNEPSVVEADEAAIVDESTVLEEQVEVPHYALPTLAFDARRKSLPAFSHFTPVKAGTRPSTSDGASIARIVNPFEQPWWARPTAVSTTTTPSKARRQSVAAMASPVRYASTPSKPSTPARVAMTTPRERFPRHAAPAGSGVHAQTVAAPTRFRTPLQRSAKRPVTLQKLGTQGTAQSAVKSVDATPVATPRTRYPRLAAKQTYEEHANTAAPAARFQSPAQVPAKRPSTVQKLPSQKRRQSSLASIAATPTVLAATSSPTVAQVETPSATPKARFPRLAAKQTYEEHASTIAGPPRYCTPTQASLKRPGTTVKLNDRRVAFAASTPTRTPVKAASTTPGNVPMTPHPAAPLRGVLAYVDVYTLDGSSASAPFSALLQRLGARTTKTWSDRVTHVVFKDGSPKTLQNVRLRNKEVEQSGKGTQVHCVNSRWVSACEDESCRVDETDEAYTVDVTEIPRGGSRRRKSMEPSALLNIGGNIVRDRRTSMSRTSMGRSPIKALTFESPVKQVAVGMGEKENSPEEPATPAYLAAPDKLVQMTAPMNRVRKLQLGEGAEKAGKRRLTSLWE